MSARTIMVAAFVMQSAAAALAAQPLTVAGMTLDEPFAVERCPQARKTKMEKRSTPCWVASLGDEKKKDPEFRDILWPGKYNAGPFGYGTMVMVENGLLILVSFKTTG